MSRAQRQLSLPEELERLEQQITLTLQEIDSNFSKAHRIVTGSILPIVEQYAKHSNDVWEGSKFWKQFFEASANVSLSGYEEATLDEDATQTDTTTTLETPQDHVRQSASGADLDEDDGEEFSVDSPTQITGVQTTPKLSASTSQNPKSASFRSSSPRKYTGKNPLGATPASEQPSTPRPTHTAPNLDSSPFQPAESVFRPSAQRPQNHDPLMHRVLDKNYRVQATPHTQRRQPRPAAAKPTPATATQSQTLWDDSPESSPAMAPPQLRSDLFSPAKAPRTPGVSVLTPAGARGRQAPATSTGRRLFSPEDKAYTASKSRPSHIFDDSDNDDDDLAGFSPPKTMQFNVPQSRLVQTPAREASKRIVEDLLMTAGADATDEIEGGEEGFVEEPSPSVVRKAFDVDDDTF